MRGFVLRDDEIHLDLVPAEIHLIGLAGHLLAALDVDDPDEPAAARLNYRVHPDDPGADARFRDLTEADLRAARSADRDRFTESMQRGILSIEDAEAWLRVIGEARLVLAARLGIEEDGWEQDPAEGQSAEMLLLRMLGAVQDELVGVLLETL
jgi:hypothetical protein